MNKKFISNTAWIIGGQIFKSVVSFIISIYTAKFLGPTNYGLIGYVAGIITLFTAVANLGLSNIIVKELLVKKDKQGTVIGTAITLEFFSSVIAYCCVIVTIYVLNIGNREMLYCAILQGLTLVFNIFNNISYYYQSRLESKVTTIIGLIAYVVVQCYKIFLLATGKGVIWFSAAMSLDVLVISVSLIISYFVNKAPRWQFSFSVAKVLIKQSAPFILAGCISVIYATLDKIMLKELLGGTGAVGYYNVAHSISHVWVFVLTALITSFSPLVYGALNEVGYDNDLYKKRCRQMYCVIFWIAVFMSICVDIVAPIFIPIFYGEAYRQSIIPTMLLTWSALFAYLGTARGVQFVCERKQKYIIIFSLMTVVLNAALNFWLIPILETTGAAIATVVSEFFVCLIAPVFFRQTRNISFAIIKGILFINVDIKEIYGEIKQKLLKKFRPNNDTKTNVSIPQEKNDENNDNIDKDNIEEEIE